MTINDLLNDLRLEIARAEAKWGAYNSAHEGISVIREEWEELWEHVRANTAESPEAIQEALHVACTAIRFAQGASTGWHSNRLPQTGGDHREEQHISEPDAPFCGCGD